MQLIVDFRYTKYYNFETKVQFSPFYGNKNCILARHIFARYLLFAKLWMESKMSFHKDSEKYDCQGYSNHKQECRATHGFLFKVFQC